MVCLHTFARNENIGKDFTKEKLRAYCLYVYNMLQLQGARKRTLLITVISHTTDVARQLEEHSREELM